MNTFISTPYAKADTNPPADTLWASGYELYDRLSPPWKRFAESLTATYKSTALANAAKENPKGMDSGPRGASGNVGLDFESHHPVVRTHPITGWKSWFAAGVNCFRIDDVTDMESEQILTKITRLITDNHDLQCRFRWEDPGDLGESSSPQSDGEVDSPSIKLTRRS